MQGFISVKYGTEFKESTIVMAPVIARDEFEEILSQVCTQMCPILCRIVDDRRSGIRESAKSLGEGKWIGVGIEISAVSKELCNLLREYIGRMDVSNSERARKRLSWNRFVSDMTGDFLDDILRYRDVSGISPGWDSHGIDSFFHIDQEAQTSEDIHGIFLGDILSDLSVQHISRDFDYG